MDADVKKIALELTYAEALVLFKWLVWTETAGLLPSEHEAEEPAQRSCTSISGDDHAIHC